MGGGSPPFIMIQRSKFSEISDRALEDGDLRGGIAGGVEFRADLVFEVGGIADLIDQHIKEAIGGQQAAALELLDGLIGNRNVGAADVENDIVMSVFADPLKS